MYERSWPADLLCEAHGPKGREFGYYPGDWFAELDAKRQHYQTAS